MENLLLLHGALGSALTLEPLREALANTYRVHTLNFEGHGGRPFPEETFSITLFARNVLDFLDSNKLDNVHVFGYSMGGYVGLYLAHTHPERFKSIFTLATKFAWSEEAAAREIKLLNPEKITEKIPSFATILAQRHQPQSWAQNVEQTAHMMLQLGKHPLLTNEILSQISLPVQVAVGDKDNMVTLEETIQAYRCLPNGCLLVLPNTRHPLETIAVARLQTEITLFVNSTLKR